MGSILLEKNIIYNFIFFFALKSLKPNLLQGVRAPAAILGAMFRAMSWRHKVVRVNGWRFYCDFGNSRRRDIAGVSNMFNFTAILLRFCCDFAAIFYRKLPKGKFVSIFFARSMCKLRIGS